MGIFMVLGGASLLVLAWGAIRSTPWQPRPVQRPGRVDVTFVGDSITAGGDWQTAFPDLVIANHGVNGDTSTDVLARLASIRATGAHTYLVMLGINDILRGSSAEDVASRLEIILSELRSGGRARVILQSTLPCQRSFCGQEVLDRVVDLNQRLKRLWGEQDFLDLHHAMGDATGSLQSAYSTDGLHLNRRGYSRWEAMLAPVLAALSR